MLWRTRSQSLVLSLYGRRLFFFITVRDNWTEGEKYLQNANGPGNVWENNGPQVDTVIRERAGLEAEYRDLKK